MTTGIIVCVKDNDACRERERVGSDAAEIVVTRAEKFIRKRAKEAENPPPMPEESLSRQKMP